MALSDFWGDNRDFTFFFAQYSAAFFPGQIARHPYCHGL